jgi:ribosomal protein S18 acetylase RimI-like enzyme
MRGKLTVRDAVPRDAATLVDFNLRMAMETEGRRLNPTVLACGVRSVLRKRHLGFYLVAQIAGKAAGCLMVTTEWSDWRNGAFWWVQSVYVVPEFRRRGVFRALYGEVKRRAKRSPRVCGCRLYVERDNAAAQATYARLGLAETRYRVYETGFLRQSSGRFRRSAAGPGDRAAARKPGPAAREGTPYRGMLCPTVKNNSM